MLNFTELLEEMAKLSAERLEAKKFGKHAMTQAPVFTPALKLTDASPSKAQHFRHIPTRYIPQKLKYVIWKRDKSTCTNCHSSRNLNINHIKPVADGGSSTFENLRLLCFQCNQRRELKRKN